MIALLGWSLLFSAVALSKAPAPEEGPRVVIVSPLDGQQLTKVAFVIEVFGAPAGSSHAAGGAGAEPAVEACLFLGARSAQATSSEAPLACFPTFDSPLHADGFPLGAHTVTVAILRRRASDGGAGGGAGGSAVLHAHSVSFEVVAAPVSVISEEAPADGPVALADAVRAAFGAAAAEQSRLSLAALQVEGFSGRRFRHFLNHLVGGGGGW